MVKGNLVKHHVDYMIYDDDHSVYSSTTWSRVANITFTNLHVGLYLSRNILTIGLKSIRQRVVPIYA